MRRKDRAVTARADIEDILRACRVCRLAMNDTDGTPYIVPLNFGYDWSGEQPVLYLHCAQAGHKLDLLRRDARVSFEMDCGYVLEGEQADACTYTNRYASVIGKGRCEIVTEDDARKKAGLLCLMNHVAGGRAWQFTEQWVSKTALLCVHVDSLTAKRY